MHSFLNTLGAFNHKPASLLFINDGVRLVAEDSIAIGELEQLEEQGVGILACGTCLSRLDLVDQLSIGQASSMYDITGTMLKADKVISL